MTIDTVVMPENTGDSEGEEVKREIKEAIEKEMQIFEEAPVFETGNNAETIEEEKVVTVPMEKSEFP